jgi:peptidoglycan/xylan/chitin deacetylase (PgdA/CDA1 family)
LCFDDGYLDFRQHALPILRRRAWPVTHFLVADSVAEGVPPWTYRMNRIAVARGWSSSQSNANRIFAGGMNAVSRADWLAEQEHAVPAAPPLAPMLRADDIRAIGSDGVEWGSHTASHGFLDRLSDAEVERELSSSKGRLETLTGAPIRFLAYPNGYYDDRVLRIAESLGYSAAFTVQGRPLAAREPRFALPRFDLGGHPTAMLGLEITGLLSSLRRLRSS